MPKVLIYRSRLLPISETFIKLHYDSLKRYDPIFCGLREVEGLNIASARRIVLDKGPRPQRIKIGSFKAFGCGGKFKEEIISAKPDLIHAHFAVDAADMLPVARSMGIPLVVTLHGYDVTYTDAAFRNMGMEGRIYLSKRKKLFEGADLFLPVSRFIEGMALSKGVPKEKSKLHYLGVNLDKFHPNLEERDNSVLYVGRLVEKKGLNLLIEAMHEAGANEKNIALRIIGDGPKRNDFLKLAKDKLRNVQYLGAQPHERVVKELSKARIFCVPSIPSKSGDNEGLPISYMEASAMALPVVSFAQGGILEAVKDEVTGLLAPTGNVQELAVRLRRLFDDRELCRQLGRAGRKYVEEVFDVNRQSNLLEEIYDDILFRRNT